MGLSSRWSVPSLQLGCGLLAEPYIEQLYLPPSLNEDIMTVLPCPGKEEYVTEEVMVKQSFRG
jgi:hypothetical protein